MLPCRVCLEPVPFPWLSPCSTCLLPSEDPPARLWQGEEIAVGRSARSFCGSSYRVFKEWKARPTRRLVQWARAGSSRASELDWIRDHADLLIPMPQGHRRSIELGHWPAGMLALWISKALNLPVRALLRPHQSGRQALRSLSDRHRSSMIFSGANQAQGLFQAGAARWLLIDDLRTTGATLEAAARALRGHGARGPIAAWTLGFRPVIPRTQPAVRGRHRTHPSGTQFHPA
jgi:predicted amidophosphoribosyltransferase